MCGGSDPANAYFNVLDNNRQVHFKDQQITVCQESLQEGGYKLNSLVPYTSSTSNWLIADADIEIISNPVWPETNMVQYFTNDPIDGWVLDAQLLWDNAVADLGAMPNSVTIKVKYNSGAGDGCVGANEEITLEFIIVREY